MQAALGSSQSLMDSIMDAVDNIASSFTGTPNVNYGVFFQRYAPCSLLLPRHTLMEVLWIPLTVSFNRKAICNQIDKLAKPKYIFRI